MDLPKVTGVRDKVRKKNAVYNIITICPKWIKSQLAFETPVNYYKFLSNFPTSFFSTTIKQKSKYVHQLNSTFDTYSRLYFMLKNVRRYYIWIPFYLFLFSEKSLLQKIIWIFYVMALHDLFWFCPFFFLTWLLSSFMLNNIKLKLTFSTELYEK